MWGYSPRIKGVILTIESLQRDWFSFSPLHPESSKGPCEDGPSNSGCAGEQGTGMMGADVAVPRAMSAWLPKCGLQEQTSACNWITRTVFLNAPTLEQAWLISRGSKLAKQEN